MAFSKTRTYGQATVNGWPVDYQIEIPDCVHRLEALKAVIKDIQLTIDRFTKEYADTLNACDSDRDSKQDITCEFCGQPEGTCSREVEPNINERVSKLEDRLDFLWREAGY